MNDRGVGDPASRRPDSERESSTVIIKLSDFHIQASSLTSRRATRVPVNGESFAVFEVGGDILQSPSEPLGFFHRDTRYLSRFELKIAGEAPYYLNSYTSRENAQLRINPSNIPILDTEEKESSYRETRFQIERNWVIAGAALLQKVILVNYSRVSVEIPLDFLFGVDFTDVFEVRGFKRSVHVHGFYFEPVIGSDSLTLPYRGLDGVRRFTRISRRPLRWKQGAHLSCLL